MKRFIFAALILLSSSIGSAWAYRVVEQKEESYELVLAAVNLPRAETGFVRFRTCSACETISLRVAGTTTYFVNGALAAFPDFLEAAATFRRQRGGDENTAVYVFVDIESKLVNRLALDHFEE